MGRFSSISFALLLLSPAVSAATERSPEFQAIVDCYSAPLKDPTLDALSGLSAGLNRYLKLDRVLENSKEINAYEKKVLRKYPQLGLVLRDVGCRAIAVSTALCGLDLKLDKQKFNETMQDEETDAIRHFVFAYLLASTQGTELTRLYTTAHEGDPEHWDTRSLMDIENNMVGIQWIEAILAQGYTVPTDDRAAADYALQALREKHLLVAKEGKTRCAAPEIQEKPAAELLEQLDAYYERVSNMQICKGMAPRSKPKP